MDITTEQEPTGDERLKEPEQTKIRADGHVGQYRTQQDRNTVLESGEFCAWPKLNTRGYPCTLGVPTASVLQKGYPLAQAHCTAFTSPPVVFMCFAVAPDQTATAACTAPSRCADCVGNTT